MKRVPKLKVWPLFHLQAEEEKEEKEEKEGKAEKEKLVPIVSASLSWLKLTSEQIPSAPSALAMPFKFACRYSLK